MASQVIETRELTRLFGGTRAVDALDLSVGAGEIFGLLGHNGAGKTTTIRMLNGVLEATSGSASVLGLDPRTQGPHLRAQTGVLTETPSLDERLTAFENLAYTAELYNVPVSQVKPRIQKMLDEFELAERGNDKVAGYSKGMKQRLALARALIHKPSVLFLDEPTSGLDPLAARHVNERINTLSRRDGVTVFLCTHNLMDAQKLCDRVAVMEHGKLVALGTPTELTSQFVRRLDVDIEVAPEQVEKALRVIESAVNLVSAPPRAERQEITVSVCGHEAIPGLVALLVANDLRIYRLSPQEANLEEVYFALHGEEQ